MLKVACRRMADLRAFATGLRSLSASERSRLAEEAATTSLCPDELSSGRIIEVASFYANQKFVPCGSGIGNIGAVRLYGATDKD